MKKHPNEVTVSAAVPQALADRLRQIAHQKGISLSQVNRAFLAAGVERYDRTLRGKLS